MSNLNVTEVTEVATKAAREASPDLKVVGVTFSAGGGEYAEVLLNIQGCRKEPCQVAVGVFRNLPASELQVEIATKLREHMREHHE